MKSGKKNAYRTIGPRHFEAAAFQTCQILFEGNYSSVLKPMVHYIPLKKDFSNFDEVVALFEDFEFRQKIIDQCHEDLILSRKYSYANFIKEFDELLNEQGYIPLSLNEKKGRILKVAPQRHNIISKLLSVNHQENINNNDLLADKYIPFLKNKPVCIISKGPSLLNQYEVLTKLKESMTLGCTIEALYTLLVMNIFLILYS